MNLSSKKHIPLVALVDDLSPYSIKLYQNIKDFKLKILFYGPKKRPMSKLNINLLLRNAKKVWTTWLYPFQIVRQARKDCINILHLQLEFNTFGSPLILLLLPIMLLLLKLTKIKIIITLHTVFPRSSFKPPHEIKYFLFFRKNTILAMIILQLILIIFYQLLYTLADKIIVHSHVFKKLLEYDYKAPESKITVIDMGIDFSPLPDLNHEELVKLKNKFHNKKVILFFGALSPRKGIEYLMQAFSQIKTKYSEYALVIAGAPSPYFKHYTDMLRASVEKMGLHLGKDIFFIGPIKEEQAPYLFMLSEIIIFPYLVLYGMSSALTRVVKYEKPIIATQIPAFTSMLVDGRNALLVPPRDVKALKNALCKLMSSESLKKYLSENLVKDLKKYSWKSIAEKTYRLYVDVLSNKQ